MADTPQQLIDKAQGALDAARQALEAAQASPLADAAHGQGPTVISELSGSASWTEIGLSSGSVVVAPVRTEAGLWAILEVWSDFRDAFTPQDMKLIGRVAQALAKKTPAA